MIHPVRLCLRTRRAPWALCALVMCGGLLAASLTSSYAIAGRGDAVTPLVRLVPLVLGLVVGVSSGTAYSSVERLAGKRLVVVVRNQVVCLTAMACAVVLGSVLLTLAIAEDSVGMTALPVSARLVRGTVAYCGLAVVSATVIGHAYAWVLPTLSIPLVTLFGFSRLGVPYGWNPLNAPLDETLSWIAAGTTFLLGLALLGGRASRVSDLLRVVGMRRQRSRSPARKRV